MSNKLKDSKRFSKLQDSSSNNINPLLRLIKTTKQLTLNLIAKFKEQNYFKRLKKVTNFSFSNIVLFNLSIMMIVSEQMNCLKSFPAAFCKSR